MKDNSEVPCVMWYYVWTEMASWNVWNSYKTSSTTSLCKTEDSNCFFFLCQLQGIPPASFLQSNPKCE